MVEGRDAGCRHAQEYLSVRNRWLWKIDELQPFITTELFRSHGTHMSFLVFVQMYYGLTARAESHSASPGLAQSG